MKKELQTTFSTRQYMLSKDFELYYYNDKNLTSVDDHAHNYWEFYFFLEGEVDMFINQQYALLNHGDVVVVPPGTRHHAAIHPSDTPYRRFIFWISRDYGKHLKELSEDYVYLMNKAADEKKYFWHFDDFSFNAMQTLIFSILEEIHTNRFGRKAKIETGICSLLLDMNREIYDLEHGHQKENESLYESIIHYIESHIDENLSLDVLAKHFFVSRYYISHVFKDGMGISVHQYIVKKRLSMARDAILDGTSASDACTAFGFSDYSVFYRAFVHEYGISPAKYCAQLKQRQ